MDAKKKGYRLTESLSEEYLNEREYLEKLRGQRVKVRGFRFRSNNFTNNTTRHSTVSDVSNVNWMNSAVKI
jgi:hypothetical protein